MEAFGPPMKDNIVIVVPSQFWNKLKKFRAITNTLVLGRISSRMSHIGVKGNAPLIGHGYLSFTLGRISSRMSYIGAKGIAPLIGHEDLSSLSSSEHGSLMILRKNTWSHDLTIGRWLLAFPKELEE